MFSTCIRRFIRDERGGYTIWSLIWFMLYVAVGGLAVDVTDAYRNEIMLQSTADASAMAAVFELPSEAGARAQAIAYSADNMDPGFNGNVLLDSEVVVGNWDFSTRTFTADSTDPNAVWVATRRAEQNQNPVGMNFLRILALFGLTPEWNVSTEAIAAHFVPDCLQNGIVAHNKIDITSNNTISDTCFHGQNLVDNPGGNEAVDIGNNNQIDCTAQISMPSLSMLKNRPNVYSNNPGLDCAVMEGDVLPQDAYIVDQIIDQYELGTLPPPAYMLQIDPETGDVIQPTHQNINEHFAGPFESYHVYHVHCSNSNQQITIPSDSVLNKVMILSDCQVSFGSGVSLKNVILTSSAKGNGQDDRALNAIHAANALTIGDAAFCGDSSGQVHIYASASVDIAAAPGVYGLRIVTGGSIKLAAQGDITGISAEAGMDAIATAGGNFEYCPGGIIDGPFAWHYRLVL